MFWASEKDVKELEMNLLPSTGINIDAEIVDPNQWVYKMGRAQGLLRLEISIEETELGKVISAYPSHYGTLLNLSSHSGLLRKKSACVPITLIFGQEQYWARLKKPEKRPGAWIPAGPVTDKHGPDVKLTGALVKAGFPVLSWTHQVRALNLPKPQARPLQPVKFLVQGKTWTLLSQLGLTQSGGPPTPKPYR